MIISHKHKFIFIKTKKTAGTSVEVSLSRYCGEEDVITPLEAKCEALRTPFNINPQNYGRLRAHSSAGDALKLIGKEKFDEYYKFCFEREPLDKIISYYWYWIKTLKQVSLEDFMKHDKYKEVFDYPLYTIDKKVCANHVGEYSNLLPELTKICQDLSIPFDGWMPNAKGDYRQDRTDVKSQFTQEQIQDIYKLFTPVMELMNYSKN